MGIRGEEDRPSLGIFGAASEDEEDVQAGALVRNEDVLRAGDVPRSGRLLTSYGSITAR